jgi:hypothetical protein
VVLLFDPKTTIRVCPDPTRMTRPDPGPLNTSPPIIDVKAKNQVTAVDIKKPKICDFWEN